MPHTFIYTPPEICGIMPYDMNGTVKSMFRGMLRVLKFVGIGVGVVIAVLLLLLLDILIRDRTVQCGNDDGEKILFSYDQRDGTVDIGWQPTYYEHYGWIDFMEVRKEGFIAVVSQNTYSPESGGIVPVKYVNRYTKDDGYASWSYVPHDEAADISGLHTLPRREPDMVFPMCAKAFGGIFIQTFITALRV